MIGLIAVNRDKPLIVNIVEHAFGIKDNVNNLNVNIFMRQLVLII